MATTDVQRDERGRWIKAPVSPAPITHANARSLAERRWQKFRQTAASRVMREAASLDPTVQTPADAWGVLNARLFTEQMDKPRGDDVAQLGRNIGALPLTHERIQAGDGNSQPQTVNILQIVGGDAARELMAEVQSLQLTNIISNDAAHTAGAQAETIDVDAVDTDSNSTDQTADSGGGQG